jgi:hypothetical protein
MSKSTTLVTTTTSVSKIIDDIRADAELSGKIPTKQRMLNTAAKFIAGGKHDWSYLTGATGPVIQKGMPEARMRDLEALGSLTAGATPKAATRKLWKHDSTRPALTVKAELTELYKGETLALMKKRISGELIAVSETFYFDHEYGTGLQCKLDPMAILAGIDTTGLRPIGLWGASSKVQEMASAAYFASSANGDVNDPIFEIIENWDENLHSFDFKALHMPHAVVIIPENPFGALSDMDITSPNPDDWDEDLIEEWDEEGIDPIGFGFRVLLDKNIDAEALREASSQVEDLLNRLAVFLEAKPEMSNIRVVTPKDDHKVAQEGQGVAPSKQGLRVTSHVAGSLVHGGYDDAPSLSLWIDEEKREAHLLGHSGSMYPISGPMAPDDAPQIEVVGKSGYCTIFGEEEIEEARLALEAILSNYTPGAAGRYTDEVEGILRAFILEAVPYKDWLDENDPDTAADLYPSKD